MPNLVAHLASFLSDIIIRRSPFRFFVTLFFTYCFGRDVCDKRSNKQKKPKLVLFGVVLERHVSKEFRS